MSENKIEEKTVEKTREELAKEAFDELRKFKIRLKDETVRNAEIQVPNDTVLNQAEAYAKSVMQERIDAGDPLVADMMEYAKTKQIGLTQDNVPIYMWTDEDDIKYATLDSQIAANVKKLIKGKTKLSEGYNTALQIYQLRQDIQSYNARRWEIYGLTADAAGEEAVHKFLCAETTVWEDGERIFKNMEDFEDTTEEKMLIRNQVIAHYMKLVRLQNDYSSQLTTEEKFFRKYGYMDSEGNILDVNKKKVIMNIYDEFGAYYDDDGNYVEPLMLDE